MMTDIRKSRNLPHPDNPKTQNKAKRMPDNGTYSVGIPFTPKPPRPSPFGSSHEECRKAQEDWDRLHPKRDALGRLKVIPRPADMTPLQMQAHIAAWSMIHATKTLMKQQALLLLGPGPIAISMPVISFEDAKEKREGKPGKVLHRTSAALDLAAFRAAHKPNTVVPWGKKIA